MSLLTTLKRRARYLKTEIFALYLAARDPRIPWYAKLLVAGIVAYAFSPIDLIPDFIPILGYLDDLILLPMGIALAIKLVPDTVLTECRARAQETIQNGKPVSWVAGAVIVAIWLGVVAISVTWVYKAFSDLLILWVAAFLSAAISGAAGFGGALLLLPLLVATVGIAEAVPLLTVAQLLRNASRVGFGLSQIQWKPVGLFLIGAIPFSFLGAISFVELPNNLIKRLVGIAIITFVVLRYFGILKLKPSVPMLIGGGGIVGLLSGLVGSAGPLGAAIFLSLGLPPVAYVASEAVTALVMHSVKIVVYQQYISLGCKFWFLSLLLGIAMVSGTWSAKRVIEQISHDKFQMYVAILLIIVALYMVITG